MNSYPKKNFSQQYIFHLMSIVTMDNRYVFHNFVLCIRKSKNVIIH